MTKVKGTFSYEAPDKVTEGENLLHSNYSIVVTVNKVKENGMVEVKFRNGDLSTVHISSLSVAVLKVPEKYMDEELVKVGEENGEDIMEKKPVEMVCTLKYYLHPDYYSYAFDFGLHPDEEYELVPDKEGYFYYGDPKETYKKALEILGKMNDVEVLRFVALNNK